LDENIAALWVWLNSSKNQMTYEPMHSAEAQSVRVKEKIYFGFVGRVRDFSVWPIRSEPFRSQDFSVLVVLVSRHFRQAMKSCRNLICSLFYANVLKSTNSFIKKNYKHDPRFNS